MFEHAAKRSASDEGEDDEGLSVFLSNSLLLHKVMHLL